MRNWFLFLCLLALGVAGGCGPSERVPAIDRSAVQAITIHDFWDGLSPAAPIRAMFRLKPATDCYAGTAQFSVAGYTGEIRESAPITVPLPVIEQFFELLESTPVKEGEYKPTMIQTDAYPEITITVESKAGNLRFYTTSQGDEHTPWQVSISGQGVLVTDAGTPAQALKLLDPYLARSVEDRMINEAHGRGW